MALSFRQRVLKRLYPLFIWAQQKTGNAAVRQNQANSRPRAPFHALTVTLNNGKPFSFAQLKGKKVLLVNTASDCGYTPQYAELQSLYEKEKPALEIIGFPANDFKEQEKGSDEEIANFCAVNFGVGFPLAKKSVVAKTAAQHPVFQWLTQSAQNGWNDEPPSWNFCKYLVNEEGVLTHCFAPGVSPLSAEVAAALNA